MVMSYEIMGFMLIERLMKAQISKQKIGFLNSGWCGVFSDMMIKCNNLEEKTILKANHNTIKIRATYQINDFKVNSCLITDWVKILQHIIKCVVLSFVVSGSMFYELEKRAQQRERAFSLCVCVCDDEAEYIYI